MQLADKRMEKIIIIHKRGEEQRRRRGRRRNIFPELQRSLFPCCLSGQSAFLAAEAEPKSSACSLKKKSSTPFYGLLGFQAPHLHFKEGLFNHCKTGNNIFTFEQILSKWQHTGYRLTLLFDQCSSSVQKCLLNPSNLFSISGTITFCC